MQQTVHFTIQSDTLNFKHDDTDKDNLAVNRLLKSLNLASHLESPVVQ